MTAKVYAVGIGPGSLELLTPQAEKVLRMCTAVAGYQLYLDQIAPKRAYLVHMCHDLTHEDWLARLAGTNVEPAYDGLILNIGDKP